MNTTFNSQIKIFWNFTKLNFLKFIKNWMNIILSLIFPIVWLIIGYFSFNRDIFIVNGYEIKSLIFTFVSMTILPAASIALMNIPISLGSDRINNRLKIYRTLNISKTICIGSNIFVNLMFYLLIWIILILISNFGFGLYLQTSEIFICLFLSILNFVFFAQIGIFLSQLAKTDKSNNMLPLIVFYPIIFLTGITIPNFVFDANVIYDNAHQWFKYMQFIIPGGQVYFIEQNIILGNLFNKDMFVWNVDFLSILIPIIEYIAILILTIKVFKWK